MFTTACNINIHVMRESPDIFKAISRFFEGLLLSLLGSSDSYVIVTNTSLEIIASLIGTMTYPSYPQFHSLDK